MTKARDCKRLKMMAVCSPTCVMGMDYHLDGEHYQKCRNDGMLFPLTEETKENILALAEAEVNIRIAKAE